MTAKARFYAGQHGGFAVDSPPVQVAGRPAQYDRARTEDGGGNLVIMTDLTLQEVKSLRRSVGKLPPESSAELSRETALQMLDQLGRFLSERERSLLPPPPKPSRPIFVYGALKPGELAYEQIRNHVLDKQSADVPGAAMWVRDGLPLLQLLPDSPEQQVKGWLLELDLEGYETVRAFEPHDLYRWAEARALLEADTWVNVNVLEGRAFPKGGPEAAGPVWRSADDPVLTFGPGSALRMFQDLDPDKERLLDSSPGEDESYWDPFFRLQGAYLLLWTVYERLTALRYGPSLNVTDRLHRLEAEDVFREAFLAADANTGDVVYDSRDLDKVTIGPDGSKALDYWYQVRSNLSHRGKSAYRDSTIVYEAFQQAHLVLERLILKLVHPRAPDTVAPKSSARVSAPAEVSVEGVHSVQK